MLTKEANSDHYEVRIGDNEENKKHYPSNYIRTTKYTALTFLPLALFNQFKRYANIYFLFVAILQSIPAISPLSPISSWAPLIFVISLSIIREAFEDLTRYKSDKQTNATKTKRFLLSANAWEEVEWKDIYPGDLLMIQSEEYFPADLVVLQSSDKKGTCFIMTSSLDGEKNLKPKFTLVQTQKLKTESLASLNAVLVYGKNDENLYTFGGTLEMDQSVYGLSAKQLLLRGASLKNTEFVVGVAAYTGKQTKIMLNSGESAYKQSEIEKKTNYLIMFMLGCQVVMCTAGAVGSLVWNVLFNDLYTDYIPKRYAAFGEAVLLFFTLFILLTSLVPISLIISLDMVKLMQAYFINKDLDMYDKAEKRFSSAFSSSLMEELGQIEYIFSDKTGTLTCNVLEFKYAFVGDNFFGDATFIDDKAAQKKEPKQELHLVPHNKELSFSFEDQRMGPISTFMATKQENFVFKDGQGKELYRIRALKGLADHFLMTLSLCHDVIADRDKESGDVSYSGMSPDEVALVDAAKHLGYVFKQSTNVGKVVEINGQDQEFEVLQFFEFDSERKRSSIILKHEGVIKHLMKGADSIIIQRLKAGEQPYLDKTKKLLEKFSLRGLRTLCYSMRVLSDQEYAEAERKLKSFDTQPDKTKLIAQLASELEQGFHLIGCTAVEDKLQDKVPQTIADCLLADIKVWMLTGDKLETAENIAFSCRLIQDDFQKIYLRETDDITLKLDEFQDTLAKRTPETKISLIVEGPVIMKIVADKLLAANYVRHVLTKMDSVVCCRMSPNGKGDVVQLIKTYEKKITLAIGDGANDVNMIQRAHIGVGLYGKEGMRAVQASDYGLVEFKALWKLLFVHGHWSYIRVAEMIHYFYFKNIAFALPHFFYVFYNQWSGQTIYDDYYITFFNLIFTAWPVLIRATFDQDLYYKKWTRHDNHVDASHKTLFENKLLKRFYPHLYYVGQKNVIFT